MATSPPAPPKPTALVVEPRYSGAMPWILVLAAVAVAVVALVIRPQLHRDSVVLIQTPAKPQASTLHPKKATKTKADKHNGGGHHAKSYHHAKNSTKHPGLGKPRGSGAHTHNQSSSAKAKAPPAKPSAPTEEPLVTEKKTTTDKPTSDSTFSTLFGIAAVLLLLGAFYTRVSKITVAGNSLELIGATAVAAQDSEAVAGAVGKQVAQRARKATAGKAALTPEQTAKLVEAGAAAAARVQSQAIRLRLAASVMPTVAHTEAVPVSPGELHALSSGGPLPDSLLKKLAAQALKDVGESE